MQKRMNHIKAVSKQQPSLASANTLIIITQFIAELVGSYAVLQRQAAWKTPFPQFVFEADGNDGGDGA